MKKIVFVLFALVLLGCSSDNNEETIEPTFTSKVSGVIEKGPFVQGSVVTLYELDAALKPTGKSYTTTVKNDEGAFDFGELNLVSKLVKLSISGYYFNEVTGATSISPIVLSAYSNVDNRNTVNVNILNKIEL